MNTSDVKHVYVGTGLGAGTSFSAKPSEMEARSWWRKFRNLPPKGRKDREVGEVTVRTWQVVQCLRCKWVWDDDDPEDYVCPCIEDYGNCTVRVLSEGATNVPKTVSVA